MEDKAKICEALLPVLQMTQNLSDLMALEYRNDNGNGEEIVIGTFACGYYKTAYVTADSGTAMIKDIVNRLA